MCAPLPCDDDDASTTRRRATHETFVIDFASSFESSSMTYHLVCLLDARLGKADARPRVLDFFPSRLLERTRVFGHVGNHFGSSLVGFAEGRIYIPIRVILDRSIEYHSTSLVGPHDHGWKRTASGSVLDLDLATASLATRLTPRIIHPLDRYLNHGWCVGRRRARTVNER